MINQWIRRSWPAIISAYDIAIPLAIASVTFRAISKHLDCTQTFDDKSTFLIAFIGLSLSILTTYITILRPFLRKPRLAFSFDEQWSLSDTPTDPGSWFYRIRVENYGLTKAANCVGRLIGVWSVDGTRLIKFDPLPLFWARQGKVTIDGKDQLTFRPIDIQGYGDFDFLDLAQAKNSKLHMRVAIPPPLTLKSEPEDSPSPGPQPDLKLPGTYFFRVGVYAGDTFIAPFFVKLQCPSRKHTADSHDSPCGMRRVLRLPQKGASGG